MGKIFGTVLAVVIIVSAPLIEGKGALFNLMKQVAATFDVPLMAIVFVGILSKRTPAIAAWAAVAVGVTFYATTTFGFDNHLFGTEIHWLHVAGLNFVLMMVVMLAFRLAVPLQIPFEQQDTRQVDITPWRWAKACSAAILVSVAGLYLWLYLASRPS